MTPPTNNNNRLPHQNTILPLLFLLLTTALTVTNAQCPNNCDPCIGRTVNYIQCPTTNCAQFVQCIDGVTSQTFSCAAGLMFDIGTSSCGWIDPTIQGKLLCTIGIFIRYVGRFVCWHLIFFGVGGGIVFL